MPPVGDLPTYRHRHRRSKRKHLRGQYCRLAFLLVVSFLGTLAYLRLHRTLSLPPPVAHHTINTFKGVEQEQQIYEGQMSVPEASLNQFLEQARGFALARLAGQTSYHGNADQPLFLVMGNGAGDADSLTSAISLSYLLSTYSHEKLPLKAPLPSNAVYVPLIQTNRSDSHLRPENEAILAAAGIKQEQILYLSDLTDSKAQRGLGLNLARAGVLSPSKGTYLGLVDHPQLEVPWLPTDSDQGGSDPGSERQVKLLVDHHADSGRHQDALLRVFRQPEGTDAANPTGSAQSIVVDLFSEAIKGNSAVFPQNLANMAISTVLIDTDNVSTC